MLLFVVFMWGFIPFVCLSCLSVFLSFCLSVCRFTSGALFEDIFWAFSALVPRLEETLYLPPSEVCDCSDTTLPQGAFTVPFAPCEEVSRIGLVLWDENADSNVRTRLQYIMNTRSPYTRQITA